MSRKRPMVRLTLSPEAWEMAGQMAEQEGVSRSALVERLIRSARDGMSWDMRRNY